MEPSETFKKVRAIDSMWAFAVAVAVMGPLALPLLWRNPRFGVGVKITLSVAVALLTAGFLWMSKTVFQNLGAGLSRT